MSPDARRCGGLDARSESAQRLYRSSLNGQRAEAVIFLPAVYTNSFLLGVTVSGDNPSHTRHAVSGSP